MPYQFDERIWTIPHNINHGYVHLFQVLYFFSTTWRYIPRLQILVQQCGFHLVCKLDNSELFRHGVARVVQYTQTATIRQRQLANRSTGSRFAVNAFRYTRNLINHLSLDGNAHRKSIYMTLRKYFASNCQGLLKMLSIRLESNASSQLKSTRHTRSRFARH